MSDLNLFDEDMDDFDDTDLSDPIIPNDFINEDLLQKLLDDDIDNEETLFKLVEKEHIPQLVLNKIYINDNRFDYICGLSNLFRRLLRIHDDVVNQWMGIDLQEENSFVSIISFVFEIIDHYYERLCFAQMIEFSDLYFSLYDYLCSIICSFIMTLNDEQINIAEDLLFENLFSSVLTKVLLASDIICFICRTSKTKFAYDTCHVIFLLLNEIYTEDVEVKDPMCETAYSHCRLTQDILITLLNRIIVFLEYSEIQLLKNSFPFNSYWFIWKFINCKLIDLDYDQYFNYYDQLYLITRISKQEVSPFLQNFISSSEEYSLLINLRLLENLKFHLKINEVEQILVRFKSLLESQIIPKYKMQLIFSILKIMNVIPFFQNKNCINDSFMNTIRETFLVLFEECETNFITKMYYFITLQNIACSELFSKILPKVLIKFKLRKDFKLHLKFYMRGKFMTNDEREIYITHELKKNYQTIYENIENETATCQINDDNLSFEFLNLLKRTFVSTNEYPGCKRIKSVENGFTEDHYLENINNFSLIQNLESLIEDFEKVTKITSNEKEQISSLANKLLDFVNRANIT